MKRKFFWLALFCCLAETIPAQPDVFEDYRNFPIVITIQFHSLSLPFRNLKSNFSNIGIGLGTEVSYKGRHNWVQQFNLVWYRNRTVGNGLLFYTQAAWRPTLAADVFAEIKIGAGYLRAFRPVASFRPLKGEWLPVEKKGKSMLALPAGVSLGYNPYAENTYLAPFASYQLLLLSGYSRSIPLVPETLLQVGARIHP